MPISSRLSLKQDQLITLSEIPGPPQFGLVYQYPFGAALALLLMGCILAVAAAVLWLGQVRA